MKIITEQGEINWAAFSPDYPGCVATGVTKEEAEQHFREALKFHLEGLALAEEDREVLARLAKH